MRQPGRVPFVRPRVFSVRVRVVTLAALVAGLAFAAGAYGDLQPTGVFTPAEECGYSACHNGAPPPGGDGYGTPSTPATPQAVPAPLAKARLGKPVVKPARPRVGRSTTISGVVESHAVASATKVYLYRKVSGRYRLRKVLTVGVPAGASALSVRYRFPARGAWAVRTYHSDAGHSATWSSHRYITVY